MADPAQILEAYRKWLECAVEVAWKHYKDKRLMESFERREGNADALDLALRKLDELSKVEGSEGK